MDRRAWWARVHRVAESDTTEVTWHARMGRIRHSMKIWASAWAGEGKNGRVWSGAPGQIYS